MRYLLACLIFVALFFAPGNIFSADYGNVSGGQVNEALNNLPHVRFLPPNPLYYLSRVKEPLGRFFTASSVKRAQFDFMTSGKRLKEAYELNERGEEKRMQGLLDDYGKRLGKSSVQINKARSQNQEVIPAVEEMISDLNYHETIIIDLYSEQKAGKTPEAFEQFVMDMEKIRPGIKERFKLVRL